MKYLLQGIVIVLAAVAATADVPPLVVERRFSTSLYPVIQRALTPVSNLVPFALLDVLVVGAVSAAVFLLFRSARTAWRHRHPGPAVLGLWRLAVAAAVLYLVFLGLWGLNYRRLPMADRLVLDRDVPSTDAVASLGLEAATRLNTLHAEAHRIGWTEPPWRDEALRGAFASVQPLFADARLAVPGRLKSSIFGPYFRWTSVDGMVNPFGLEVLGNPDVLPFELPFVAAHEWSHLAGYALESDANFVGWVTCLQGGAPAQYSGWLYLFWQVYAELGRERRAELDAALAPGPRADLDAIAERVRSGQLPWLRTAGWQVYDQYLRANRVEGGVRNYGAVVTLILRAKFDDGWVPVRRSDR